MLAEFEVRNYRGFRDKLQFSLESGKTMNLMIKQFVMALSKILWL